MLTIERESDRRILVICWFMLFSIRRIDKTLEVRDARFIVNSSEYIRKVDLFISVFTNKAVETPKKWKCFDFSGSNDYSVFCFIDVM